jgi:hypothetical protein
MQKQQLIDSARWQLFWSYKNQNKRPPEGTNHYKIYMQMYHLFRYERFYKK